ncbi:MAG: hypothetical protein AAF901_12860 [Bacteroidota bacterium]
MFETLDYEVSVELLDTKGHKAIHSKREQVRYIQNNIIAYQDQAWGEGDFLKGYHCSPGKLADSYREGDKTILLISLQGRRQKGDIDTFHIERKPTDTFTQNKEYTGVEISHKTKQLTINIFFPKKRPPTSYVLVEKQLKRHTPLSSKHLRQLKDGRWLLSWSTSKPRLFENYFIQWEW